MKDNRGFSLIELIITMAIIAILACGTAVSRDVLTLADAQRCAKEINQNLDKLKLESMSKADKYHYLVIEWDSSKQSYYLNAVFSDTILDEGDWKTAADKIERKKIAGASIEIKYSEHSDGTGSYIINDSNPCILITVNPGSGAYLSNWKQIAVHSKAKTLTIHMVTETGKHYIS